MSIKVVLLKTGERIITDIKEIFRDEVLYENVSVGYILKNPIKIEKVSKIILSEDMNYTEHDRITIQMSPWIEFTEEKEIPVNTDTVIAIVEPLENLKELYLERVNGTTESDNKVYFTEE
jgi:hypothetical protein